MPAARVIPEWQKRTCLAMLSRGISISEIASVTGIPSSTWQTFIAKNKTFADKARKMRPVKKLHKAPKDFNLAKALKDSLPEVFDGLMEECRSAKGTARVQALVEIKKWAEQVEIDTEPLELADTNHDPKITNISEAV